MYLWHVEIPRLEGCSCSCQPMPQPQPRQIQASTTTYTTAHGNARSLTHWARPGIEPSTSQFLVGIISAAPRWELLGSLLFLLFFWLHPWHMEVPGPGIENYSSDLSHSSDIRSLTHRATWELPGLSSLWRLFFVLKEKKKGEIKINNQEGLQEEHKLQKNNRQPKKRIKEGSTLPWNWWRKRSE